MDVLRVILDLLLFLSEFEITVWGSFAYFMLGSTVYVVWKLLRFMWWGLQSDKALGEEKDNQDKTE